MFAELSGLSIFVISTLIIGAFALGCKCTALWIQAREIPPEWLKDEDIDRWKCEHNHHHWTKWNKDGQFEILRGNNKKEVIGTRAYYSRNCETCGVPETKQLDLNTVDKLI